MIPLGPKPKTKSRVSKKLRKVQPPNNFPFPFLFLIPPAESLQSENVNWAAAISHFSCFVVLSLLYSCDGLTKDIGNSRD
jgi:hypothetical protein